MIKIENTDVYGFEAAIRGMRNPMNSWDKSDSDWKTDTLGENDLALAKKLSKAGSDHAKYLRMINVSLDLTVPLYFWKQFDQYKVGVTTNSCSTMHKIHAKEFEFSDFSMEHLNLRSIKLLVNTIDELNYNREKFLETKNEDYWWQMIQLLPNSYNQKRTVQLNYAVLKNMYHARKAHKLDEWRTFCVWMKTLPYFKEICIDVVEE